MKIISVSVLHDYMKNDNNVDNYLVEFSFDCYLDNVCENYIKGEWFKSNYHNRDIKIIDNELRLFINKNDNIQLIIDFVKNLVYSMEKNVPNIYNKLAFSQELDFTKNYTKNLYCFSHDI